MNYTIKEIQIATQFSYVNFKQEDIADYLKNYDDYPMKWTPYN